MGFRVRVKVRARVRARVRVRVTSLYWAQSTMLTSFLDMGACSAMMTMALPDSGLELGLGWFAFGL